jgi:spermidine synthase
VLHRERSFFGDLHVRRDPASATMQLLHGTTLHGKQSLDPSRRAEPLAYFHKSGPVGELFRALRADKHDLSKVAVTGLGIGTLLCYAEPGETWTYFEIDPAVTRVAQDTRYFTYMSAARERGVVWDVVAGDARLQLERADAGAYKFMVSDVFSSDAIPVHLLTKEAIELYRSKLEKSGLLLFNISNRYLRLEPVLAALAQELNLVGLVKHDHDASNVPGKTPSSWLILAERAEDLPRLPSTWRPLENSTGAAPWTDDYSNLLGTIIWRH